MIKTKKYLIIIIIILLIPSKVLNLGLFEDKIKIPSLKFYNVIYLYKNKNKKISIRNYKNKIISYKYNNIEDDSSDSEEKVIVYQNRHIEFTVRQKIRYIENSELLYSGLIFYQNNLKNYNINQLFVPIILFLDNRNKIRNLLKSKFNGSDYKKLA